MAPPPPAPRPAAGQTPPRAQSPQDCRGPPPSTAPPAARHAALAKPCSRGLWGRLPATPPGAATTHAPQSPPAIAPPPAPGARACAPPKWSPQSSSRCRRATRFAKTASNPSPASASSASAATTCPAPETHPRSQRPGPADSKTRAAFAPSAGAWHAACPWRQSPRHCATCHRHTAAPETPFDWPASTAAWCAAHSTEPPASGQYQTPPPTSPATG